MRFLIPLTAVCWALVCFNAPAATRYVDLNCTNPVSPYMGWVTAATNIQNAVDVSFTGDLILVTNGIYQTGSQSAFGANRVNISRVVTVQSVHGPAATTIMGKWDTATNGPNAVRCVYLANGAVLSGFTLTNSATTSGEYGGGVRCISANALVTNCVITGNSAYSLGGGTYYGTLVNCELLGNRVAPFSSTGSGGGAAYGALVNCLLAQNFVGYTGGAAAYSSLINCTVVSNSAAAYDGSLLGTTLKNCIVYYNHSYYTNADDSVPTIVTNSCISFALSPPGANNITNPPLFANLAAGDYHLLPWSPCVNAGNNSFIANATDLDGNTRIIAGTVDIGAYEFQSPVHFVRTNSTASVPPFTNWLTAATNIQDAVDAANAGDFVVASNGVYKTGGRVVYGVETNRVVLTNAVTLISVNGVTNTLMVGGVQMRCVYIGSNSLLSGFTLTNGQTAGSGDLTNEQSGGGAWCETGGVISNCVVTRNIMAGFHNGTGGGIYGGIIWNSTISTNTAYFGGGVAAATVINCLIVSNSTYLSGLAGGGGAYSCTLSNCTIVGNGGDGNGGGAYNCVLNNSVISNNLSWYFGGGAYNSTLTNCKLIGNFANGFGGGADLGTLINCLVISNSASVGGGANGSTLYNCVVANNKATNYGDGVSGAGNTSMVWNSILYYNNAPAGSNYDVNVSLNNCCTMPLPFGGSGNITNAPLFVNVTNDFHLQSNSPCINAGNNSYVTNTTDLDGNARTAGGTVDIGAYEFQSPSSVVSYAYLQQYGLPTDGSADTLDSDGDGMNNWQEWKAGTIPTDATSLLQLSAPSNSVSGVIVTWQSVTNVTYYLLRSTNLPAFTSLQSNIVGQAGSTSYTDTTATNDGPFFYRVGVQ